MTNCHSQPKWCASLTARERETHTQHIYPWSNLELMLETCPFELLGAYSGFTFNKGSARSDRVHFVLRRP